ncbi:MAG: hypothetical protein AAF415_19095 [Pseudomonadota bacterium]
MGQRSKQATRTIWTLGFLCVTGIGALWTVAVRAQENAGPLVTLGVGLGADYEANDPGDDDTSVFADLVLGLSNSNRVSDVDLRFDGRFQLEDGEFELEDPGATLLYSRANRSTALDLSFSYREQDADGDLFIPDPLTFSSVDLIEDDGSRETIRVGVGLQTGLDARFGTDTELSFLDRTFTGTSDPDLTDLQVFRGNTALRFDVSPALSLRVTGAYVNSDEEDIEETERETFRVGIGATARIDQVWSVSTDLRYARIDTDMLDIFTGAPISDTEEGVGFNVAVVRALLNGDIGLSLGREITETGDRDEIRLSRSLTMANGSELSGSIGLVDFEEGDVSVVGGLSFALPTRRGGLLLDFQQQARFDEDDGNVINTFLTGRYESSINAVSNWAVFGTLARVDSLDDLSDSDQTSVRAGISYDYAITRDWDLSAAFDHRIDFEGDSETDQTSVVSLTLQRSFSFRP